MGEDPLAKGFAGFCLMGGTFGSYGLSGRRCRWLGSELDSCDLRGNERCKVAEVVSWIPGSSGISRADSGPQAMAVKDRDRV